LLLRVSVDIAGVRMVKAYGRPPWLSYLKSTLTNFLLGTVGSLADNSLQRRHF
jgi:hypothetical protein